MKNEIRNRYKELRRGISETEVREMSRLAAQVFLDSDLYKNSRIIMLYIPLRNETDTKDIIKKAFEDGKVLVFPITERENGEITPYFAEKDTVFKKGNFSVFEPCDTQMADPEKIDVVIVPGIAFDKSGNRIGFGKGCYDKFLKSTKAVRIGYCYEAQLCEEIPADGLDERMDWIITEKGLIEC